MFLSRSIPLTVAFTSIALLGAACSSDKPEGSTTTAATATAATTAPAAATTAAVAAASPSAPAGAAANGPATPAVIASFKLPSLTVPVGARVQFTNNDSTAHTASAEDGSFDSKALAKGDTFVATFTKAGVYKYRCDIHDSMTGTITVQ